MQERRVETQAEIMILSLENATSHRGSDKSGRADLVENLNPGARASNKGDAGASGAWGSGRFSGESRAEVKDGNFPAARPEAGLAKPERAQSCQTRGACGEGRGFCSFSAQRTADDRRRGTIREAIAKS
ncbi:hypothetical protein SKAU_G00339780 [Synaphobranchus kaupii]|uniref:Uncharacterized protein n=1 Tax=Synaphobranchus kaupii TaxID=118154 RepID=A0A9Q1IJ36_SYNKA|nr:hypothetical protein SKAU_G00339780 [Synaphobranchus kaupii]